MLRKWRRSGNPATWLTAFHAISLYALKQRCRLSELIGQNMRMGNRPRSPRVLLVDEDADVRESLERGLSLSGFAVAKIGDGAAALRSVSDARPDAIVVNIGMPVLPGIRALGAMRDLDGEVPVCVLSAPHSVDDRIAGLEVGADDYLIKPFALSQLVARLRAMLRSRSTEVRCLPSIEVGPMEIDFRRRCVRVSDIEVALTRRQFDLLAMLAEHESTVLSRSQLLKSVWGYDCAAETDVVDHFIGYLRHKLEAGGAPRVIHSVSGVGFMLGAPP